MMIWAEIGVLILKILLRCKFEGAYEADIGADLADCAKKLGLDFFEARKFERGFTEIADEIAKSCLIIAEDAKLTVDESKRVSYAVVDTLNRIPVTSELLAEISRNPIDLEHKYLDNSKELLDDLSEREYGCYINLIAHSARVIIEEFNKMDEFAVERIEYLMNKIDEITCAMEEVLTTIISISEKMKLVDSPSKYKNFEISYLNCVDKSFGKVQLFGADSLDDEVKKYPISTAYVQLEVEKSNGICKAVDLSEIFGGYRNVWMSGEAGSGKTTCLYWIAISIANGKQINGIQKGVFPIVIELRHYIKDDKLNITLFDCLTKIMSTVTNRVPDGWADEKISEGNILFLIDGFDEISPTNRDEFFSWIDAVDPYDRCYKIYTSRPQIKSRPFGKMISEVKMLPMNQSKVEEFIEFWHETVLEGNLKRSKEESMESALHLLELLENNEPIRKLATNPLLCAMICALHYKSQMTIPTTKRELYEDCCRMLMDGRNAVRGIDEKRGILSYETRKLIMAKLASHMMRNNYWSIIEKKNVVKLLDTIIKDFGITETNAEELLEYMLLRFGLICEPQIDSISFIHRSFEEYLCAFEIDRQDDWGFLQEKIGDDNWQETICMAIGIAKKEIVTNFINAALKLKEEKREEKYTFCALEYIDAAKEKDGYIRDIMMKELNRLIPPDSNSVNQIGRAGDIAVPFLRYKASYDKDSRYGCMEALRRIGTLNALKAALKYLIKSREYDELCLICAFCDMFPKQNLKENKAPDVIFDFVLRSARHSKIIKIPYEALGILNLLPEEKIYKIIDEANGMIITDYSKRNSDFSEVADNNLFLQSAQKNINNLFLSGQFEKADILRYFYNLKEIYIENYSHTFCFKNLNMYGSLYYLDKCTLVINQMSGDFYANELEFLYNCKELVLVVLYPDVSLYLDGCEAYKGIKIIRIFSKGKCYYNASQLGDIVFVDSEKKYEMLRERA